MWCGALKSLASYKYMAAEMGLTVQELQSIENIDRRQIQFWLRKRNLKQLNLKGINMIQYLERFLVILGAFQPLITFSIGLAAIYISVITYKNAYLTRKHEELIQLSKIKRELYNLYTKIYINYLRYHYELDKLKGLIFESDLNGDEMKSVITFVDDLIGESAKILEDRKRLHKKKLESTSKLTDINKALDILYKVESLVVEDEEFTSVTANKNLGLVKVKISMLLHERELGTHTKSNKCS